MLSHAKLFHRLIVQRVPIQNLIGHKGEKLLSEIGFKQQMVSMGHQACGALQLWNYPIWMRDLVAQNVDGTDRPNHVDMPALEGIYFSLKYPKMISFVLLTSDHQYG